MKISNTQPRTDKPYPAALLLVHFFLHVSSMSFSLTDDGEQSAAPPDNGEHTAAPPANSRMWIRYIAPFGSLLVLLVMAAG